MGCIKKKNEIKKIYIYLLFIGFIKIIVLMFEILVIAFTASNLSASC